VTIACRVTERERNQMCRRRRHKSQAAKLLPAAHLHHHYHYHLHLNKCVKTSHCVSRNKLLWTDMRDKYVITLLLPCSHSGVSVNGVRRQLIVKKGSSPRLVIFMSDNGNVNSACPTAPAIGCGVRRPAHKERTIVGCSLMWVLRPEQSSTEHQEHWFSWDFLPTFSSINTFSIKCMHDIAVILLYITGTLSYTSVVSYSVFSFSRFCTIFAIL